MRIFLIVTMIVICQQAAAQQTLYDSVNQKHNAISRTSLKILSGWSAVSLVSGLVGANNNTGDKKYFYKRNVLWGSINLGLSGLGLLRLKTEESKAYSPAATFKRIEAAQKTFLFNAGLDLAYVAFGLYTRERANRYNGDKKDRLIGTGNSLIVQGGFLTLFDGVLYALHNKNRKRLDGKLQTLTLGTTQNGLGLVYNF